jgi:hypothetical protein
MASTRPRCPERALRDACLDTAGHRTPGLVAHPRWCVLTIDVAIVHSLASRFVCLFLLAVALTWLAH